MGALRPLLRGSGRALALVFFASVLWLLLDMAALRISLGDAGGRRMGAEGGSSHRSHRSRGGGEPTAPSPAPEGAVGGGRGAGTPPGDAEGRGDRGGIPPRGAPGGGNRAGIPLGGAPGGWHRAGTAVEPPGAPPKAPPGARFTRPGAPVVGAAAGGEQVAGILAGDDAGRGQWDGILPGAAARREHRDEKPPEPPGARFTPAAAPVAEHAAGRGHRDGIPPGDDAGGGHRDGIPPGDDAGGGHRDGIPPGDDAGGGHRDGIPPGDDAGGGHRDGIPPGDDAGGGHRAMIPPEPPAIPSVARFRTVIGAGSVTAPTVPWKAVELGTEHAGNAAGIWGASPPQEGLPATLAARGMGNTPHNGSQQGYSRAPSQVPELGALKRNREKGQIPSKDRFILISKERVKPASPAAPHPGSHSARNSTESQVQWEEQQLANGAHAANVITGAAVPDGQSRTLGATQGPTPRTSVFVKDRQGPAGSIQGMHKVLSVDATLAPRDPQAPGQFGHAVAVPDDKQEEAKSRWKEGNFNVYLSDLIPVDRAIADTRPAGCSEQQVHNDLPTTTIIMCFVDEVWSTLLRSIHSVLSRSPPHLIEEIILVDDFSTKEYLKEKLDKYMSRFPKVKILHLKERHGLIRARLAGAEVAKGTVLTFLDSHVECNVGWLEPLLERVRLSRTKVACPVIEVISDKDMSYMTVDNFQRGIFTWPMNFGWKQIPQEVIEKNKIKETDIIRCPVMAGGLFSIDKKYFFELGTYDPGLDVWGGENLEISFKVWMCGGEVEIVPCSRVGHIFRNDNPYSFPKDRVRTVERNLARVAEVWLDEYKELFYGHAYHLILKNLDVGNLTQQIQLRKKLQCKSFRWYLENIYPDLEAPLVKASGLLVNTAMLKCITVENNTLALEVCDVNSKNQKFNYTWLRLIQHGELCLAPAGTAGALGLRRCQGRDRSLTWLHRSLTAFQPELADHVVSEHLQQLACLEVDPSHKALQVNACDSANPYQKWQFGNYYAD